MNSDDPSQLKERIKELEKENEQLKQSCQLHKKIVESLPLGIQVFDRKGFSYEMNPAQKELLGLPNMEEGIGQFNVLTDPYSRAMGADKKYEKAYKGETYDHEFEYDLGAKENEWNTRGDKRIFHETIFPIKESEESVKYVVAVLEDKTKERKAQQALKESEERHRITLNSIGDAVISTDTGGNVVHMNPVAQELTGWDIDQAKNQPFHEVFHIFNARTGDKAIDPVDKVLETGAVQGLANHTKLKAKDGKEYQIADSAAPIQDGQGNLFGVVTVFRDVTGEYRKNQQIKEYKEFLDAVFTSIQEGISVLDKDLNIHYVNPVMEEWFRSQKPLIGKKCYTVYRNNEKPCDPCPSIRSMQSKKVEYEIVPVYSSDAAIVHWHEVYSYPIIDSDSGEVTGIVEFVRDVTQRKHAEKEKFEYLREFEVTLKGLGNIQVFRYRKNKDDQSVVTFSEGKIAESFNITTNQVKGKTLTEVMGKEYANKLKPYFSRAFAGETVEYDFQSGERWFSTKLLPFETTSDGDVLEIIGTSAEITERKKTEQSLQESEDKFKAIFEASPDATFLANRTTGIIVDANHAAERLFETKLDNIIGRHQSQLHPTEQNEKAKHTFKYKSKYENELAPPVEIDIITAKNNRKNVEIRGQIVNIRDEEYVLGTFRDITEHKKSEEALKKSEQQFRQLFEQAAIGIFIGDVNHNVVDVNEKALSILGYSKEEMLHMNARNFIHPDDLKKIPPKDNVKNMDSGEILQMERRYCRKDGDYINVLVNMTIFVSNEDRRLHMIMFQDITERKQAEKELQIKNEISNSFIQSENESFYKEVLDIFREVFSSEYGFFGYINEEGDLVSESLTRDVWNECQIEDRSIVFPKDSWTGVWGESLKRRKTLYKNGNLQLPEGHVQLTSAMSAPIMASDQLIGLIAIGNKEGGYDNYDKKQINRLCEYIAPLLHAKLKEEKHKQDLLAAKEKAEESEKLTKKNLRSIKFLADSAINFVDDHYEEDIYKYIVNKIKELNPKASVIVVNRVDYDSHSLKTKAIEISDNNLNDLFNEMDIKLLEQEYVYDERLFALGDGKVKKADIGIHELTFEAIPKDMASKIERELDLGNIYGIAFLFNGKIYADAFILFSKGDDLENKETLETFVKQASLAFKRKESEEELIKAKEKAEESDRLKSAFLANMSHEIRTPMNGIMGFSQMLTEKEFPKDKQSKFLGIIHSRTQHLLQIISDIVDIAKIESGQLSIDEQSFYLNEIIKELYDFYKKDIKDKGKTNLDLKIQFNLTREGSYLKSDPTRLRQVLDNLLTNAIKFTDEGEVEIGYREKSSDTLLLWVSDTGIGISPENYDNIFERFRQVDDASNRLYEGTGLGLTISKNLVELLGGEMWVDSKKGEGSVFYFTLPYKSQDTKPTQDMDEQKSVQNWQEKTILIVEDDLTSLEYMKEIIEPTGATTILKKTGEEGFQAYKENFSIDLILMDIRLPDISGLEIIKRIRKTDKKVKIIAQTAHAMGEDRNTALQSGANDYISKPIGMSDLLRIINKYIGE